jgi:TRAP-type C4-dicarboxylate transport system substrate-binding protein
MTRPAVGREGSSMTTSQLLRGAIALLGTVALAACGTSGGQPTKSGQVAGKPTVLRLEVADAVDADRDFLIKDVARVSHGALKLQLDTSDAYDSTNPANEARLVTDLRSGKVGFGYVGARDFAAAGSTDFQAVDAPFVITTSEASQQFASSSLATKYLGDLRSMGVVGIGVVPSEPRGFTTRKPLMSPSDFAGARIRIIDNPETAAMVSALGADPVQKLLSTQVGDKLRHGALDGVESSPSNVQSNGYQSFAPYSTSYALFPKLNVFAASTSAWSHLSPTDQGYLKKAVSDTLDEAAGQVPLREAQSLGDMCKSGSVIDQPSASDFAAIVKRAQSGTPQNPAVRKDIAAIKATIGNSGPQPLMTEMPPECIVAKTVALALATHRRFAPVAFHHRGGAQIPDGTYLTTTTVADFRAGGQYGADWNKAIRWTWRLQHGHVYETQQPDYPDQGPCSGTYSTRGDEVSFNWGATTGCTGVETLRWSYYEGKLSFAIVDVADSAGRVIYTAHPWQKVS